MHPPVRQVLRLSHGTVTLRAWGSHVADAFVLDLLTVTATLGVMREQWPEYRRGDLTPDVWGAYWRLVHASLDGCALPQTVTWADRLTLLMALWELNDLEDTEGKLTALKGRALSLMTRLQGRTTAMMRP